MRSWYLALALACGLGTAAAAQSIAGEWDAAMNTPGGVRTFKLLLQVDGEKLSGTVKRESGDVPLSGTLKGSEVQFSYSVNYNGNALLLTIRATVLADSLKGVVDFGGAAEDEFRAKKVRPPAAEVRKPA